MVLYTDKIYLLESLHASLVMVTNEESALLSTEDNATSIEPAAPPKTDVLETTIRRLSLRTYIFGIILFAVVATVIVKHRQRTPSYYNFPVDFVWGAATSSYQIEGAVHEGGTGSIDMGLILQCDRSYR